MPLNASILQVPAILFTEDLGRLLYAPSEDPGGLINNRISRGLPMPPSIVLPGSKRRLWLATTVLEWLKEQEGDEHGLKKAAQ